MLYTDSGQSHRYIIKGDPLGWAGYKLKPTSKMFDSYKQHSLNFTISLENQHEGRPPFKGLLGLDVSFYFAPSKTYFREVLKINGKYYTVKPDISSLIEFIEKSCIDLLFHPESVIVSVCAQRFQDKEARTEFTVKELR